MQERKPRNPFSFLLLILPYRHLLNPMFMLPFFYPAWGWCFYYYTIYACKLQAFDSPWYSTYVDYALVNSIINGVYTDYDIKINRSEFVNIFYKALPDSEYTAKNTVGNGMIPDVPVSALYSDKIYAFYRPVLHKI